MRRSRRSRRSGCGPWHRRSSSAASTDSRASVAQLGAPADNELLELGPDRIVERGLLILLERRPPYLAPARGRVPRAALRPTIEVLGGGEQRPVEALAEARERVGGAEKVAAGADLRMRIERKARLGGLE